MIQVHGYEIVKLECVTPIGSQERGIAIAKAINPDRPCQWVTWRYVKDNGFDFYSGNYFDVERLAFRDYYRRLMEEYDF